jgi:4-oxalocrotonate tautomerase
MPYVNVKITRDGVTAAQKKKIVQDITQSLVTTLGKKPEHIHIVIDEVDPENWGYAGMLTTEYRAMEKKEPNPSPQRNAGSRRSSGDSTASETPSSLGPRG